MASDVGWYFSGANDSNKVAPRHALQARAPTSPITESKVLIESEFLELNDHLQYSNTVHILLTNEFVFVKEMRDRRESEAFVLQYESAKTVSKFRRCDVHIRLYESCPFTFQAKWSKEATHWKTYELCGKEEVWPKWLRSFSLEETRCSQILPSSAICEIGGDTDSDDSTEDEDGDGEDVQLPKCTLPLTVDRAISMWSVAMLNPSNVRRLHNRSPLRTRSSDSSNDVDDLFDSLEPGSLYRSNSHPRVAVGIPFRYPSLPNVGGLENVHVDADLKIRIRGQKKGENRTEDSTLLLRETESGLCSNHKTSALVSLQERVENLRAHPSNLNFISKSRDGDLCWHAFPSSRYNRKLSLAIAMNSEANRIPMPSDASPDQNKHGPVSDFKVKQSADNKQIEATCVTPKLDSQSSARKTDLAYFDRHSYKRADSLPCPRQSDLSHAVPSIPGREGKGRVVKRLDFKDDMAVHLTNTAQKPRKDKVRRFWTILHKKRSKLRMPAIESDELVEKSDDKNAAGIPSSVEDPDLARSSNFVRRGGFSGSFSASKDMVSVTPSMEEPSPLVSPVRSRQGMHIFGSIVTYLFACKLLSAARFILWRFLESSSSLNICFQGP